MSCFLFYRASQQKSIYVAFALVKCRLIPVQQGEAHANVEGEFECADRKVSPSHVPNALAFPALYCPHMVHRAPAEAGIENREVGSIRLGRWDMTLCHDSMHDVTAMMELLRFLNCHKSLTVSCSGIILVLFCFVLLWDVSRFSIWPRSCVQGHMSGVLLLYLTLYGHKKNLSYNNVINQ